ncbi:MAG: MFS transporter [Candidatus Bathyarchaeales archaeon]
MTLTRYRKILRLGFPFEVLNRDLKLIFASNLVGSFGDGLYAYLLPYYMTETIKASPVEVGILYAVMSLTAAFTLLIAGMIADKYDRKKIMIAGWIAWRINKHSLHCDFS